MTHGERVSYQRGCRCTRCKAANAAYVQAFRLARAEGRRLMGARVPAQRTHIAMKLLRIEGFTHKAVDDILGRTRHYARVRRSKVVTLRTELRTLRLYRERCLDGVA